MTSLTFGREPISYDTTIRPPGCTMVYAPLICIGIQQSFNCWLTDYQFHGFQKKLNNS